MECLSCEQIRKDFNCTNCLGRDLRDHRDASAHINGERDALVAKAAAAIGPMAISRDRRADVASLRRRLEETQRQTRLLRDENEKARENMASIRSMLATRRQNLDDAYHLTALSSPARTPTPTPPGGPPRRRTPSPQRRQTTRTQAAIAHGAQMHLALQDALARARQGLVQELVDVFDVVEVGGRPAQGMRAGTRGEWAIGGLVLPVPGDIRRYPPLQINAALTCTCHFLALLTFYLGVKLPFHVAWSSGKLGVGVPEICAARGGEAGGWARWTVRNPLHLPHSSSSSSSSSSPPSSSPSSPTASPRMPSSPYPPAPALSTADSHAELHEGSADADTPGPPASFTTALAMLLYDVAYLAHTQGVAVPLSHTGEVLRNLWAVCCSAELGRRSHATHPPLLPPTPPSFTLDFKQLLQATTADPTSRTRPRSRRSSTSSLSAAAAGETRRAGRHERIAEEEEWEVVEDVS